MVDIYVHFAKMLPGTKSVRDEAKAHKTIVSTAPAFHGAVNFLKDQVNLIL